MGLETEQVEPETNDATGQTDLRTQLETALDAAEADSDGGQASEAGTTPREQASPDPEQVGRVRDENGRFAKGDKAPVPTSGNKSPGSQQAQPLGQPTPDQAAQQAGAQRFDKPPPDWNPRAREHWGKLPPELREEAWRLHVDTRRALSQADQIRQQAEVPIRAMQRLEGLVGRYPNALRGGGGDAGRGLERLLMMAETMENPSVHPTQKARLLADMLDTFGIPEQMVGDAIDARRRGQPAPQQQNFSNQQQQFRDPRFDQFLGQLQQQQQQQQQQEREVAGQEVYEFQDGKEFFSDVRYDMADRVEALHKAGRWDGNLDAVYDWACWANPQIRTILQQRDQASRVSQAGVQRARTAAGASLRSSGVAPGAPAGDNSIRSLVEQAMTTQR
jgi:hypothetical protein